MKSKMILLLILVMVLATTLIGCGANKKTEEVAEVNQSQDNSSEGAESQVGTEVSNDIKEQAAKEGVSVEELLETFDGLTEIYAKAYDISTEEYISLVEMRGDTALSGWQLAADEMGMSITELYESKK